MIGDEQAASSGHGARDFGEHLRRRREIRKHEREHRRVELAVGNGQRLEIAAPQLDVRLVADAPSGGREHLGRVVHGNHAVDKRRDRGGHRAGAAAEVADRPRRIQ